MLRAIGVSLSRRGRTILDQVSLQARAGELVVVEGERGAGKSTLLEIAAALRRPDQGEVWIADRDLTGLQRASLPYVRRNVGYAGAAVPLLPRQTVAENLALALAARGHPPALAASVGARALARLGLESLGGRAVSALSEGERRLAALARALAGAPALLVVDEPSAGLAAGDVEMVLSALLAAGQAGAAVLCASGDAAFAGAAARHGARRLGLAGGRVLAGALPVAVPAAHRQVYLVDTLRPASDQVGRSSAGARPVIAR